MDPHDNAFVTLNSIPYIPCPTLKPKPLVRERNALNHQSLNEENRARSGEVAIRCPVQEIAMINRGEQHRRLNFNRGCGVRYTALLQGC